VAALRASFGLGRNLSAARGTADERHGTLHRLRSLRQRLAQPIVYVTERPTPLPVPLVREYIMKGGDVASVICSGLFGLS
jgi:hypothetical protein